MGRYFALFAGVFAVVVALSAGCTPKSSGGGASPSALESVNVGYLPMVSAITHYVAVDQGFYTKQGLDVKATKVASSNLLASQLIEGKLDAAIEVSIVPLLKGMKPGATSPEFKLFSQSNITAKNSFDGILVKDGSPIKSVADLSGKTVATFPGTTASACLAYEFGKLAPGKPAPVSKPTAPDLQLQAIETDSVNALYAYEPTLSRAAGLPGMRLLPDSGIYSLLQDNCPIGVAAVNAKFAADRDRVCKKLIAALDEAAQFVRDHPKEARDILAKAEKVDPSVAAAIHDLNMGTSSQVNFDSLKQFEAILAKMSEAGEAPLTKAYIYTP